MVVRNREGLHFRPIMKIVDLVCRFSARVTVHHDDRAADGRSPMELMMLVATQGARLKVIADGADAEAAVEALAALVESGFQEE